ncbi:hypothetical protein PHYBLDRAFT_73468 [Phycomyces blakesleeanus NRRL 1555(-)]|uniref:Uncharacterized protein n=1 Tax=Phycomyces blakesleeanus (strain ATCC 8743b / DSM 1359 / FGSC 10004 / NBRC 33097 / NRRL 1555) TaxID=763407 RepID=A0A167RGE7_PHYB8|nr:hypothetical protein PHYBLDRAFT_73468 [Phycomyces blakesleeanus NRRL 1555(-)]OAD81570.1 hypothetical protein PHYBLDRAFT_73468 [Phycomyces blakesleeanus NRRL 1555(-)]|eukprot:XP_018299610.1 hypothetical protein PHYBLDRAFT_73468 [Phycomyces blakesleeanus NRRL 1555(-)]
MIREDSIAVCGCCGGFFFRKDISIIERITLKEAWGCDDNVVGKAFWAINNQYITTAFLNRLTIDQIPLFSTYIAVSSLPPNFDDTYTIHLSLTRKICYVKNYIRGNISRAKVWRAAVFLQSTPLYQEYNITLRTGDAEGQDQSVEEVGEDKLEDNGNQESVIVSDYEAIRLSSGDNRIPLSVLTDKDSDFLSFPKIF